MYQQVSPSFYLQNAFYNNEQALQTLKTMFV